MYSSHTIRATRDDFEAWTKSDSFRDVHKNAGNNKHMYLEGPHIEGFDVVQHMR